MEVMDGMFFFKKLAELHTADWASRLMIADVRCPTALDKHLASQKHAALHKRPNSTKMPTPFECKDAVSLQNSF